MIIGELKQPSAFEFFQRFPNEGSARAYLETARWPGGVHCIHCGSNEVYKIRNGKLYTCKACRKQSTIRTGTVMEKSKIPLQKWLYTIYLMSISRKGVSSIQLAKEIGVTQKSAWFMLGRLREACKTDGRLSGTIEADESYFGGKEKNKHAKDKLRAGRGPVGKTAVFGARSRDGEIRATVIDEANGETICKAIGDTVTAGANLYTDDHRAYRTVKGYRHQAVRHSVGEYATGNCNTNGVEAVWAVLKRGYMGIFHHWSKKHAQRYLDEFVFRLNTKDLITFDVKHDDCGINFVRAIASGMEGRRLTYRELIK